MRSVVELLLEAEEKFQFCLSNWHLYAPKIQYIDFWQPSWIGLNIDSDYLALFVSGLRVDGLWSEWGNWSNCDCENITATPNRMRTRNCTDPSPSCYGKSVWSILNNFFL